MKKEIIKITMATKHPDSTWSVRIKVGTTTLWGYGTTLSAAIDEVQDLTDSQFGKRFKIML